MTYAPPRSTTSRRRVGVLALVAVFVLGIVSCAAAGQAQPSANPGASDISLVAGDGSIEDGGTVSAFGNDHPAVANLDAGLREAIQKAATDANSDGVEMVITSGWRSEGFQQKLLDEATVNYGSLEEARKWVNTPDRSSHVTGKAVDVGYTDADSWLSQHGNSYGLCQVYANEMWHFELTVQPGETCPVQVGDASAG